MELTFEEIRARIKAKQITAISVDTTVFERSRLDLESGLLRRLSQFNGSQARFILPNVVAREVQAHLLTAARDAHASLAKAVRELRKGWLLSRERAAELHTTIAAGLTPSTMADQRWGEFVSLSGVTILSATEFGDTDEVLRRYFDVQPPFEPVEEKKHEFPDAIALVSLDRWAAANQTQVLVVTTDEGWKRYCKDGNRLVAVSNLGDALDSFQDEAARLLCADLSESLSKGDPLGIAAAIHRAVREQSSSITVDVEANSQFAVEEDGLEYEIEDIQIADASSRRALTAIDFDGTTLEAEVRVTAEARGNVTFSFSKWDSVDKIHDSMGSTTIEFSAPLEVEAILTFKRLSKGELKLEATELQSQGVTLHYEDLEPDWMNEGPEPDDQR